MAARHRDAVYRQMVRVCGNYDDAEDVLVQALLAAYRAWGDLRDEDSFRGWLAIIGRRICRKLQAKEALKPLIELGDQVADPSTNPGDSLELAELKAVVRSAVEGLPEPYREVYVLRELESVPAEAVAKRLNLTVANVKSRLHRARIQVRQELDRALESV